MLQHPGAFRLLPFNVVVHVHQVADRAGVVGDVGVAVAIQKPAQTFVVTRQRTAGAFLQPERRSKTVKKNASAAVLECLRFARAGRVSHFLEQTQKIE